MKEFNHEGGRVVHERGKLKYRRDVYRFTLYVAGIVGLIFAMNRMWWGSGGGIVLGLLFLGVTKAMDKHISAYDKRQNHIVDKIWQD